MAPARDRLPLVGAYDHLGSINGFVPDFRTELLVAGCARPVSAGQPSSGRDAVTEETGGRSVLNWSAKPRVT